MDYLVVCLVALLAGGLTLISGFGLGTLLMPAFAVFFPPEVAVGATAVVHLANSLFKLAMIGHWAKWPVVWAFGLPAIAGAVAGAAILAATTRLPTLAEYSFGPIDARITPVGLLVGGLILIFAVLETWERFEKRQVARKWLPWGGLLSGFFGGLSGHQGALRSIFLVRSDMEPRQFTGTSSTIAAMVDITRLAVYAVGAALFTKDFGAAGGVSWWLIAAACAAAFVGSAAGAQVVKKVTMKQVRKVVAVMLGVLGVAVMAGIV
jgi:uncharacterized membrane protein YfcA